MQQRLRDIDRRVRQPLRLVSFVLPGVNDAGLFFFWVFYITS
jgi:hypothetical protein